jgi:hypothetical protein
MRSELPRLPSFREGTLPCAVDPGTGELRRLASALGSRSCCLLLDSARVGNSNLIVGGEVCLARYCVFNDPAMLSGDISLLLKPGGGAWRYGPRGAAGMLASVVIK